MGRITDTSGHSSAPLATVWTDKTVLIQNSYELPQTSEAPFCNLLTAGRQFTKSTTCRCDLEKKKRIIARRLFDTNQMPIKGQRREKVHERMSEEEREAGRKRKTKAQTKSERQRVSLSLSQLAVFQDITQVLPFSSGLF